MESSGFPVRSKDGTLIGGHQEGAGPGLVLVHGTAADHERWRIVLPRLSSRFTCFAMDRRGRGRSGDAAAYSLAQEADDVRAVADAAPSPVAVLGHSFGGLVALEAAIGSPRIERLVLYEPAAFVPQSGVYADDVIGGLEWSLARGDTEGVLSKMLVDVAGLPAAQVALLRRQPYWSTRRATAPTIPRELRVDAAYQMDKDRLREVRARSLILVGGASLPFYREGAERLASLLPDARVEILEGQGHAAIDTAPRAFVDAVLRFIN